MKIFLQILFLFLIWFANIVNATPVFTKVALPSYQFTFSKIENVKEGSIVKIGVQNFARGGIEEKRFSDFSKENVWVGVACSKEEDKVVKGAGNTLFKVDNALKSADEIAGVLLNGSYLKNPTTKNVVDLIKNPSGALKLDQSKLLPNFCTESWLI